MGCPGMRALPEGSCCESRCHADGYQATNDKKQGFRYAVVAKSRRSASYKIVQDCTWAGSVSSRHNLESRLACTRTAACRSYLLP
jgi:hypothetical protein